MTTSYQKRLEGVTRTGALDDLLRACLYVKPANESPAAQQAFQTVKAYMNKMQPWVPLPVVDAMHTLLTDDSERRQALETALSSTQLAYTPPPPPESNEETPQQRKFRQRMERLRLQQEETSYSRLTSNIKSTNIKDDDITAKSMTYAASVGLNMIIAPLSFGAFMYFFAGSLLDYIFPRAEPLPVGATDIKRVIIGVVSGVLMLFVEMILFVIRTHELESFTRKKEQKQKYKRKKDNPFGVYSSNDPATYQDDRDRSSSGQVTELPSDKKTN